VSLEKVGASPAYYLGNSATGPEVVFDADDGWRVGDLLTMLVGHSSVGGSVSFPAPSGWQRTTFEAFSGSYLGAVDQQAFKHEVTQAEVDADVAIRVTPTATGTGSGAVHWHIPPGVALRGGLGTSSFAPFSTDEANAPDDQSGTTYLTMTDDLGTTTGVTILICSASNVDTAVSSLQFGSSIVGTRYESIAGLTGLMAHPSLAAYIECIFCPTDETVNPGGDAIFHYDNPAETMWGKPIWIARYHIGFSEGIAPDPVDDAVANPTQFHIRSRRVSVQALPHQVTSKQLGRPL
jgi:hypothetical protein